MDPSIAQQTEAAARAARDRLAASANPTGRSGERGASRTAREAIFAEALLAAIHARLEELKSAAR
jgi:hypothetical protein